MEAKPRTRSLLTLGPAELAYFRENLNLRSSNESDLHPLNYFVPTEHLTQGDSYCLRTELVNQITKGAWEPDNKQRGRIGDGTGTEVWRWMGLRGVQTVIHGGSGGQAGPGHPHVLMSISCHPLSRLRLEIGCFTIITHPGT